MYSPKSCYEITLIHLLTSLWLFFIAMANDLEIAKKKQRTGPNPDGIKTAVFSLKRKSTNRPKITL